MFASIGAKWIDHFAVTTLLFEQTLEHYLSLPGARLMRGPGWNPDQLVHYAFVQTDDGTIEILGLPEDGESPIAAHVSSGGGAYHLCFACDDIEKSVSSAEELGAKLVVAPRRDTAFDGRRVAFLIHPAHGLFELLETRPETLASAGSPEQSQTVKISLDRAEPMRANAKSRSDDINSQVVSIVADTFGLEPNETVYSLALGDIKAWDSLGHLRLMMAIEHVLDIRIPSAKMGDLTSVERIAKFLRGE